MGTWTRIELLTVPVTNHVSCNFENIKTDSQTNASKFHIISEPHISLHNSRHVRKSIYIHYMNTGGTLKVKEIWFYLIIHSLHDPTTPEKKNKSVLYAKERKKIKSILRKNTV